MFYIHLWKYSPSMYPCQLTQGKFYLEKKKNVKALQSRKEGFLILGNHKPTVDGIHGGRQIP